MILQLVFVLCAHAYHLPTFNALTFGDMSEQRTRTSSSVCTNCTMIAMS